MTRMIKPFRDFRVAAQIQIGGLFKHKIVEMDLANVQTTEYLKRAFPTGCMLPLPGEFTQPRASLSQRTV